MSRSTQSTYPEWDELRNADPDGFLLAAESELIDLSLWWWELEMHRLEKGHPLHKLIEYTSGSGKITVLSPTDNILYVYLYLPDHKDGDQVDSASMLEAASFNLASLLDGKIVHGREVRAIEEIENQLKYVAAEKGKTVARLLNKSKRLFIGTERLEKKFKSKLQAASRLKLQGSSFKGT